MILKIRMFILLVSLKGTLFCGKMLHSTRCVHGFMFNLIRNLKSTLLTVPFTATMDPNKIVPRRGPPSVDCKISDKKVNQIYFALLDHSYSAFSILDVNNSSYQRDPRLKPINLQQGSPRLKTIKLQQGSPCLKLINLQCKRGAHAINSSPYTVKGQALILRCMP